MAHVDEAQRAQFIEDLVVEADFRGVIPVFQTHGCVESRPACPDSGAGGLSAGDFVGQDESEELGVGQASLISQCESFRQCVERAAKLDGSKQILEFADNGRGGGCSCHASSPLECLLRLSRCRPEPAVCGRPTSNLRRDYGTTSVLPPVLGGRGPIRRVNYDRTRDGANRCHSLAGRRMCRLTEVESPRPARPRRRTGST